MKKNLMLATLVLAALSSQAFTAKFFSNWKNPVEVATGGKLVLAHPGNYNGKMFAGWKDAQKKLHPKWEEVSVASDCEYRAEYAALDLSKWTAGSDGKATKHKTGQGTQGFVGEKPLQVAGLRIP